MSEGRCDICGKTGWTEQLVGLYRTKDIEFLCDGCMNDANKVLHQIQTLTAKMQKSMIQRFLCQLKIRKGAK